MNRELVLAVAIVLVLGFISYTATVSDSPTGFAVTKSFSKSASYDDQITIDFDKEYQFVNKISFEATPGGAFWCSAKVEAKFYDAGGMEVASLKKSSITAHTVGKASTSVADIKVKKVVATATSDKVENCDFLDKLKVKFEFSQPLMSYITPIEIPTQPGVVLVGASSTINVESLGASYHSIAIKMDGVVKNTCYNTALCIYTFTEPTENLGKRKTYTIEAVDMNGKSSTYEKSYTVYGKITKEKTGIYMTSQTVSFAHPYNNVEYMEIKMVQGGGYSAGPHRAEIYDGNNKLVKTISYDAKDLVVRNVYTASPRIVKKFSPGEVQISKVVVAVGTTVKGYVDSAEVSLYYTSTA